MKKGYKECPFCANEIKEGAKKCQYCKEMLSDSVGKTTIGTTVQGKKAKSYNKINISNKCIDGIKVGLFGKIWELIKIIFSIGEKRISRRKYGRINILFLIILAIIFSPFISNASESEDIGVLGWICIILLSSFIFFYTLPKRAHDCGKSGWMLLIPFYIFVIIFTEGDHGENKYGKEPDFILDIINWLPKKMGDKIKSKLDSFLDKIE